MNVGSLRLLVDTNVWLDWFIPGRARSQVAEEFVIRAIRRGDTLLYPVRILGDIFYMVDRNCRHYLHEALGQVDDVAARAARTTAWSCVRNMREVATAVGADEADVWLACEYQTLHDDLEDDFVLAAAERVRADYLVTNDRALIQHSTVAALTCEDMLKVLTS